MVFSSEISPCFLAKPINAVILEQSMGARSQIGS